jgi:hypothetical protein
MGGGIVFFRIAQFGLLAATILLVARLGLGKRVFGGVLLATGLVCCYPVLLYTGATLYPQTLAGFLFVLALFLFVAEAKNAAQFAASGICFGALILVAPPFLLTLAVVVGVALSLRMIRWRDAAWTLFAAGLVVGSWTARNVISLHHFVPVSSNSGLNFLEGNNANATPEAAANMGMQPYYEEAYRRGLDEFQSDRFYRKAAWAWIEAHPVDALTLYFEKAGNFFNFRNDYSQESRTKIAAWEEVAMATGYLLLLVLLGCRLLEAKRFPLHSREKLFLLVYVLSAFTSAVFFTRIRLRLPYDYLVLAIVVLYLSRKLQTCWTPAPNSPPITKA